MSESGRDVFGDGWTALGTDRHVSAVIDAFAPRLISERPDLAAVDWQGRQSTLQVSLASLAQGEAGERLLAMLGHIVTTYPVDSVDLTELHYDSVGFGDDDRRSYLAATGRDDWPSVAEMVRSTCSIRRSASGGHRVLAGFVARAAAVAHSHGKQELVDARLVGSPRSERPAVRPGLPVSPTLIASSSGTTALNGRVATWTKGRRAPLRAGPPPLHRLGRTVGTRTASSLPVQLHRRLTLLSGHDLAGAWVTPVNGLDGNRRQSAPSGAARVRVGSAAHSATWVLALCPQSSPAEGEQRPPSHLSPASAHRPRPVRQRPLVRGAVRRDSVLDEDTDPGFHHTVYLVGNGTLFSLHERETPCPTRGSAGTGWAWTTWRSGAPIMLSWRAGPGRLRSPRRRARRHRDAGYCWGVSFPDPGGITLDFFAPPG